MLDSTLHALRAVAEPSRLRIVAAMLRGELTVSELTQVLEQSQPRVSRHLKVLCDAGVVDRHQEGSWVFYRLSSHPVVKASAELIPRDDHQLRSDAARLEVLRRSHRETAERYFHDNAEKWERIRSKYVPETLIEARLLEQAGGRRYRLHLDLGTGTGRMLRLFAGMTRRAVGIDNSRKMLAVARTHLAGEQFLHCQARLGDISSLTFEDLVADLVTLHNVLHYLEDPVRVLREVARVLAPGGLVLVVDYASHHNEQLRREFAHRRLGFDAAEVNDYLGQAGLQPRAVVSPETSAEDGAELLKVLIWAADGAAGLGRNQPKTLRHTG